MNRSESFLSAIDEVACAGVTDAVMARARQSLLDYLAVTCAGTVFQADKLRRYCEFAQPEVGAFRAVGMGLDLALKEAVFLNGLNGHALDFDDGTNSGIIHLGSPIFSLLLPLAQRHGVTVDEVLRAAIVGYEASYTMAVSIQPGHKALGYHATGTCGTLGATLAATYMLRFSEEERFQAFASACVAASGMLKVLDDESELKPYNVAKTSLLALTAIQMAKAGFVGHHDPLGGRGFLRMMTGHEDVVLRKPLLEGTYAICKTYTKPYASCRYTHPSVEAAIRLRDRIDQKSVERIDVRTYDLAVSGHDHTDVPNGYSAKMSIPYATAVGLLFGRAGLREFEDDVLRDSAVTAMARRVRVTADDDLSAAFPTTQTAVVEVVTAERTLSERVDFPKGEPENPLTEREFRERYDALMDYGRVPAVAASFIYDAVYEGNTPLNVLVRNL